MGIPLAWLVRMLASGGLGQSARLAYLRRSILVALQCIGMARWCCTLDGRRWI